MNMPPILVLAGGLGTRVEHLSNNMPKCLIPINGRPFIDWQLDLFESNNINQIIFSVGHKENEIKKYLEDNPRRNLEITFVSDGPKLLGTGGAIINSLKNLQHEFLLIYGDSYLPIDFSKFYETARYHEACLTFFKNENKFEVSNVKKLDFDLVSYKKFPLDNEYTYVDYGLLYFKSNIFDKYRIKENLDLAFILEELSNSGKLSGQEVFNRFYEIGSENGIADLKKELTKIHE